jgi:hypothetical protein
LFERIKLCIKRTLLNKFEGKMFYFTVDGDWNISRRKVVDGKYIGGPFPEGEKDNTISILQITDYEGNIKSLLLNYSCHPVTLYAKTFISSEYPARKATD